MTNCHSDPTHKTCCHPASAEAPKMDETCSTPFTAESDSCCDTECCSEPAQQTQTANPANPANPEPSHQSNTDEADVNDASAPEVLPKESALNEAVQKSADLNDKLLRLYAEMDNLRKRHQRELENAHKYANEKILHDLLPVKDSLDLGVAAGRENPTEGIKILEGVELIQQMLAKTFERHQIKIIAPLGEKFNPEQHEAIAMMPSTEYASGVVMQVIQPGYQLNGRLTRPARVVVSRGDAQEA